ncbi:hypothetical protein EDWATA_01377 [Edwardsiella tarda ATCC 23685]|uniref:Uncharacterized protein n=1 Tax=Edwardsiella tarda ATCC 23685 TaxID=500638 RepID=D4F3R2_EDWTA|nr:hypothetical protein EDWATA_01377 [Edwardsiella tarda ATCC 23685]
MTTPPSVAGGYPVFIFFSYTIGKLINNFSQNVSIFISLSLRNNHTSVPNPRITAL